MHRAERHRRASSDVAWGTTALTLVACIAVLGFAVAVGLGSVLTAGSSRPTPPAVATAPSAASDAVPFILDALLMRAIDGDAVPLRWVDPRPLLRCGPNTAVLVNRGPLAPGARVPDLPFEVEWLTDGCRPYGAHGPRFDGRVKLTVFREDWGFSAMVEPSGLRITSAKKAITCIHPGAAWLPRTVNTDETYAPSVAGASLPCH